MPEQLQSHSVTEILTQRFQSAFVKVLGEDYAEADPVMRPSGNPKFGDYQANAAMALSKKLGKNPRELATQVIEAIRLDDICEKFEIAGPGFINLSLKPAFLAELLTSISDDEKLGVQTPACRKIVVDYSSPNVAKEMHVGHLRSTIIGDAICRVLAYQGHEVVRQNHIGDWGTQFGMLIENMIESNFTMDQSIGELNELYRASKKKYDGDEDFATRARERVVKLQGGDEQTLKLWQKLIEASRAYFASVYKRMDVLLEDGDIRGESFYNNQLQTVIENLKNAALLKESQGAQVVYPDGFQNQDGDPLPMIVQKSDGGFLYATTDLAAATYRASELQAQRVIYVTDSRQSDHFKQVFWALRESEIVPADVRLDHVAFGTVLGKDKKPFKSRDGDVIRLVDLIDEAEERAKTVVTEKNSELDEKTLMEIAHAVGLGALKYVDLSSDRIKDYVFDWDRMLSFEGNTAPYIQYSYTRIRSIFRKGKIDPSDVQQAEINISEAEEKKLALLLLQWTTTVDSVGESLEPHRLCTYLYELAKRFHAFFEACPVLKSEGDMKASRLKLCDLTARVLQKGLSLLGIQTVERM